MPTNPMPPEAARALIEKVRRFTDFYASGADSSVIDWRGAKATLRALCDLAEAGVREGEMAQAFHFAEREAHGQVEELRWMATRLVSGLENYGRHHLWCAHRRDANAPAPCTCGLSELIALRTTEVGSVAAGPAVRAAHTQEEG